MCTWVIARCMFFCKSSSALSLRKRSTNSPFIIIIITLQQVGLGAVCIQVLYRRNHFDTDIHLQVKPPAYLLVTPMPKMDLRSILDKERTGSVEGVTDASAVSVINPKTWPPLEETVLNGSQVSSLAVSLERAKAFESTVLNSHSYT